MIRRILIYLIAAVFCAFLLTRMCIEGYRLLKVRKKWYKDVGMFLYNPNQFSKEDIVSILQSIIADAARYRKSADCFFQWLIWNRYVDSLIDRAKFCLHLFGFSYDECSDITEQWID